MQKYSRYDQETAYQTDRTADAAEKACDLLWEVLAKLEILVFRQNELLDAEKSMLDMQKEMFHDYEAHKEQSKVCKEQPKIKLQGE